MKGIEVSRKVNHYLKVKELYKTMCEKFNIITDASLDFDFTKIVTLKFIIFFIT